MAEKKELSIKAKSSSGDSYNVIFNNDNGIITIFCDCPAGIWGKQCKHKTAFITGDESILYDKNELDKLKVAYEWMQKSTYAEHYGKLEELKKLKEKREKDLKKKKKTIIEKLLKSENELNKSDFLKKWAEIQAIEAEYAYDEYLVQIQTKFIEHKYKDGF